MKATRSIVRGIRALKPFTSPSSASTRAPLLSPRTSALYPSCSFIRPLSISAHSYKGIQPDSAEPEPPKTEPSSNNGSAAQLGDAEYHEIADQYLDTLVLSAEQLSETTNDGMDVEYSAGVLTISTKNGSYVINKQPPNKQIWLSSPISGPKRFDWVVSGAGQHEKEGSTVDTGDDGEGGKWVYLRDGSSLSDLLKKELDIDMSQDDGSDVTMGREGPGGGGAKLD